jgi:uncharacterized protein (DUF934 family)
MPLIKHDGLTDDPWVSLDDDAGLPGNAPIIVSLERWRAERDALIRRGGKLGIRLAADQSPDEIAGDLDRFEVVALHFPKFTDGRAYSTARLLRERYGFKGEVRATGQVLRDQLLFMWRCGFDAFEVAGGLSDTDALDGWRKAMGELGVSYQTAADRRLPAHALRRRRAREAAAAPKAQPGKPENAQSEASVAG